MHATNVLIVQAAAWGGLLLGLFIVWMCLDTWRIERLTQKWWVSASMVLLALAVFYATTVFARIAWTGCLPAQVEDCAR